MHPWTWISCEMKLGWNVPPTVHWYLLHVGSHYPVTPESQAETGVVFLNPQNLSTTTSLSFSPKTTPLFQISFFRSLNATRFFLSFVSFQSCLEKQPTPRIWRTIWFRRSMRWWAFQCNAQSPSIARLQSNPQRVGKPYNHQFWPKNRTKIYVNAIWIVPYYNAAVWKAKAKFSSPSKTSPPNRISQQKLILPFFSDRKRNGMAMPGLRSSDGLGLAGVGSQLEPAACLRDRNALGETFRRCFKHTHDIWWSWSPKYSQHRISCVHIISRVHMKHGALHRNWKMCRPT